MPETRITLIKIIDPEFSRDSRTAPRTPRATLHDSQASEMVRMRTLESIETPDIRDLFAGFQRGPPLEASFEGLWTTRKNRPVMDSGPHNTSMGEARRSCPLQTKFGSEIEKECKEEREGQKFEARALLAFRSYKVVEQTNFGESGA